MGKADILSFAVLNLVVKYRTHGKICATRVLEIRKGGNSCALIPRSIWKVSWEMAIRGISGRVETPRKN